MEREKNNWRNLEILNVFVKDVITFEKKIK